MPRGRRYFFNLADWLNCYRSDILNKDGTTYMERWILQLPFGRMLRLHHILTSDDDRHLHDHPFDFWTMLLNVPYVENIPGQDRKQVFHQRFPWRPRYVKAETLHRLILLWGPVWTLVYTGPIRRVWGFDVDGTWTDWRKYHYGDSNWQAEQTQRIK